MSAPTRQFENLSIDTQMPTTRRQAQGRISELKAQVPKSSSSESDEDSSNENKAAVSSHVRPKALTSVSKGKQPARSESPPSSTDTSASPIMARAYKTRDILSAFDENILPNDFRSDIFDRIDLPRTPAECLKQLDLEGTIFQLAVNDQAVYKSLSKVLPVQARAAGLFQKVSKKIRMTLQAFDDYVQQGPPTENHRPFSVMDLGAQLQTLVDIIGNEIHERRPYGVEPAAECLLFLLREVCNRNYDVFDGNTWGREAPRGEEEDDRNLFQYLIGNSPPGSHLFALEALEVLPEAVLASPDKQEVLDDIRGLLHQHHAPTAYRRALQRIMDPLKGEAIPIAGPKPGQKRPAAGTGRGGQKRTK